MKKKTLLMSILTIVMCLSLSVGATFALFTSEDSVNIVATSGKVTIAATIDQNSVQTKQLYDTDYTDGADSMYGGEATFVEEEGLLTLKNLVPGDAIKFNIVVSNTSNVTVKYRTVISCSQDNGLFSGLIVNIAGIDNYNGVKYVTNWAELAVGSANIVVPVEIELPEGAGNEYQEKSCIITYFVEAVQGNAKTTNESQIVEVPAVPTESITLKTNGSDSPVVVLPADVMSVIATSTDPVNDPAPTHVALKHSEPKVEGNVITFETMEIVDENGKEIDLEEKENTKEIPVTLPAQDTFAPGTVVYIYHDNVHVDTVTVDANGVISYSVTHFCKVEVSTKILSDKLVVNTQSEFDSALAKLQKGQDTTIVLNCDITLTKKLAINKGMTLTLDLNGYDIEADFTGTEVFHVYKDNGLVLKSSEAWAKVKTYGKSFVLAYGDVKVSDVEVVVGEITSSSYTTFKMNNADLTIGQGAELNVSYLGTSLISSNSEVVIDGATFWLNKFKTNAGAIISNYATNLITIKNSKINLTLDPTYTQYLVSRSAANVTIEGCDLTIKDTDGVYYELVKVENEAVDNRIGFSKIVVADVYNALANGESVTLNGNLSFAASASNAYGVTGLNIFGGTLDMNGNVLKVSKATGTWGSAISITAGTIKNVKVTQGFRGIFVNHNSDVQGKVYLENVIISGPTYTINCDQGTNNGLEATNCTFNGWTSYAATLGDVKFVNCSFGKGAGNNFSRPYAPTEYIGCDFAEGHKIDARAAISFENCTYNGVAITAENVSSFVSIGADGSVTVK